MFRLRRALVLENLALRHQLQVLQRSGKSPRFRSLDRGLWVLLSRLWAGWRDSLVLVKPDTVVRWHRKGFRLYWRWKSGKPGRPRVPKEVRLIEAFPWDTAPRYLLRDRDGIYGLEFERAVLNLSIEEIRISPHSPWHNPYVERVIGSIRLECLDHLIIFNEEHLRQILREYFRYYTESRTHLRLDKDCPEPRSVEPPEMGEIVAIPQVGALHDRHTRIAA